MQIKRALVRSGCITEDATAAEVVETMRKQIPPDLFGDATPPVH